MPLVRILSWNILQGGGRRMETILESVKSHRPDIFAIQEFRHSPASELFIDQLHHLGLTSFYAPPTSADHTNTPAIASRWPFESHPFPAGKENQPRCVHARFRAPDSAIELDLINVHLPHKKEQLPVFDYLHDLPPELRQSASLIIGDFNCGIPFIDSETKSFENSTRFQQLLNQGWVDHWREQNPEVREYTWISSKKQNGYRYDNALISPALTSQVKEIAYDHSLRETGASDHSGMFVDIRFADEGN